VNADEKGPYIWHSDVEKSVMKMQNKKAAGDDDVFGEVLRMIGQDDLKIMIQLINKICTAGEWNE
jgi:hypothetical protein